MKGTTVITDELMGYDEDANPVCVRDSTTGNPGSQTQGHPQSVEFSKFRQ